MVIIPSTCSRITSWVSSRITSRVSSRVWHGAMWRVCHPRADSVVWLSHMSSIWPWSGVPKVRFYDTFLGGLRHKITWRIQKNHQNGQSITHVAESDQPKIFPVHSAMRLVLQARWLNQPDNMPVAVYKTKKGKVIYLTGNKIAELLRKAVKKVRPDSTPDKLKRYSAHSVRVWACVLLDKAAWLGKLPTRRQHVAPTAKCWHIWPTCPCRGDTKLILTHFFVSVIANIHPIFT